MAVAPLFNADMATLKERLRLSGASASDALAILDSVVLDVRVGLYDCLGKDRIDEILQTSLTDAPTSDKELVRVKASLTEVRWVWMLLLRKLPTLFMDSGGGAHQAWNEEGLTRQPSGREVEKEIGRLAAEISEELTELKTGEVGCGVDASNGVKATAFGPDEEQDRPGESVKPIHLP